MTSLFKGIGWRIFISFTALFIVLTVVLSVVALRFAQTSATENASNELRVLSVTLSSQLQRFLKRIETGMKSLSASQGIIDRDLKSEFQTEGKLNGFLSGKLNQFSVFDSISVVNNSGVCISSTDPQWLGLAVQREAFFSSGLKHFGFSEIFESLDSEEKVLLASTPVNEGSDPHGVLVARVKLSSIYDMMGQQLTIGGNVEAFVLDSELRFITPAKNAPDELLQSHLVDTPLVQHLEDEFWVGKYRNYKGDEVLGTVLKIPRTRWFLVIEREYGDIENQINSVKKSLFFSMVSLLFVLMLVTILLTHSITKPLHSLVEGAQRIAAGDLNRPILIPAGSDEITFLATEIDRMRSKLSASQGRLLEQLEESELRRIENARLAAIGTLASSLAHEIRNPLNAVSLLISQLERSKAGEEARLKMIESMRSEIGRLDRLVSDILDYARPLQLQREKINFDEFLNELTEFYRPAFESKKIELKWSAGETSNFLMGDRDKLRQAFVNIFQNAIEAMPGGGGFLINCENVGSSLLKISMKDSGVGIEESSKGRLFDLFFTTKEAGTGLGLGTVRKIIEAHGGRVNIEGIIKKGTIVTVFLPVAIASYES